MSEQQTQEAVPVQDSEKNTLIVQNVEQKSEEGKQEDPKFAAKFAALTKKERENYKREQELLRREQELLSKSQHYESLEQVRANAKKNPLSFLKEHGLSVDDIVRFSLSDENEAQESPEEIASRIIEQKLKEKEEQDEERKAQEQNDYIQRGIDIYRKEIDDFLEKNPERYELLFVNEAKDQVYSLIEEWFFKYQEVLPYDKAADMVEDQLLEEMKKLTSLKKIAPLFGDKAGAKQDIQVTEARENKASETLRNTQVLSNAVSSQNKPQSRNDYLERAVAKLRFI